MSSPLVESITIIHITLRAGDNFKLVAFESYEF